MVNCVLLVVFHWYYLWRIHNCNLLLLFIIINLLLIITRRYQGPQKYYNGAKLAIVKAKARKCNSLDVFAKKMIKRRAEALVHVVWRWSLGFHVWCESDLDISQINTCFITALALSEFQQNLMSILQKNLRSLTVVEMLFAFTKILPKWSLLLSCVLRA